MEPEQQHDAAPAPIAPPLNLIIQNITPWDYSRCRSRIEIFTFRLIILKRFHTTAN
jgi:hypothetical protein